MHRRKLFGIGTLLCSLGLVTHTLSAQFPSSTAVAAVARTADNLDLFAVGNDGAVWSAFWTPGSGWSDWFTIPPF